MFSVSKKIVGNEDYNELQYNSIIPSAQRTRIGSKGISVDEKKKKNCKFN